MRSICGVYPLLLVSLSLLLYDDGQVILTLDLELSHLLLGLLQLDRHGLHFLTCVADLEKAVSEFTQLLAQFALFLCQKPQRTHTRECD